MKKVLVLPFLVLLAFNVNAQSKTVKKPAPKPAASAAAVQPLKTSADSLSYAFGISLGEFLKSQGISTISYPMMNLAISQTLKGQKTYFDARQGQYGYW